MKKFLYPFALDLAPLKYNEIQIHGPTVGGSPTEGQKKDPWNTNEKVNILQTAKFNFPLTHLDQKEEYITDILKPITI